MVRFASHGKGKLPLPLLICGRYLRGGGGGEAESFLVDTTAAAALLWPQPIFRKSPSSLDYTVSMGREREKFRSFRCYVIAVPGAVGDEVRGVRYSHFTCSPIPREKKRRERRRGREA